MFLSEIQVFKNQNLTMAFYQLNQQQFVPASVDKVWDFSETLPTGFLSAGNWREYFLAGKKR